MCHLGELAELVPGLDVDVASTPIVVSMALQEASNSSERYTIAQMAKAAGVTSRTLRHYDHIGLLKPVGTTGGGYREYDRHGLVRLQRILLLRELGLELKAIGTILNREVDEITALQAHIGALEEQRTILDRRIKALRTTIGTITSGGNMDLDSSFEGFNEQYKDEVIERWGAKSYEASDRWWKSQSEAERRAFMDQSQRLMRDWSEAGAEGQAADSPRAQQLAAEHVSWLASIPGTPGYRGNRKQLGDYVLNLAEMYVADERFARNYAGQAGFVRDALQHYVRTALQE